MDPYFHASMGTEFGEALYRSDFPKGRFGVAFGEERPQQGAQDRGTQNQGTQNQGAQDQGAQDQGAQNQDFAVKPPNPPKSGIGFVVDKIEESLIAMLFAAMTLVTFSQVIARYVFNSGAVWALEATTYLFAWLVLFGVAYGVKNNAHLGVDFVVKKFDPPRKKLLGLIAVSAALLYAGLLFWGGFEYVAKLYKIGIDAEDIPLPRWIFMSILPIGFGLVFVRFLQIGFRILQGKQDGLILGDETAEAMARHLEDVARDGRAERLKSGKHSA